MSFQTEAGSSYQIETINIGTQANAQTQLISSCTSGKIIASGAEISYTSARNETLYLEINNQNSQVYGANTSYSARVSKTSDCSQDAFESDDLVGSAKTIQVDGAAQAHSSCPNKDVDWVKFTAAAGREYTIETNNLGKDSDTFICLYDAEGMTKLICDDDSGPGFGSRLVWEAPYEGEFTIRANQNNPGVVGSTTSYDLQISSNRCNSDNQEPDNNLESAKSISINGIGVQHNICSANDEDWMKFTAKLGPYIIETFDLGPEADTVLELYDQNGSRLKVNDDNHGGTSSLITYIFPDTRTYYLRVFNRNPTIYGTGTEYSLKISSGTPTPNPTTPPPQPTLTPSPPPPATDVKTLILIDRAQVAKIYDAGRADQLLSKVYELATNTNVKGDVIRLDLNQTIRLGFDDWNANWLNVEKANQVTVAIRQMVLEYLKEHNGVEYIVLVGGDQLLPFRRVLDRTPQSNENQYILVNSNHPTGSALRANFYLTDNYYADVEPTGFQGRDLYLPDYAVGRLLETPEEMIAIIDAFLTGNSITVSKALITGYDFVQDVATENCTDWRAELGATSVNCDQIGDFWSADAFRNNQLNANPPYSVQSINGHADHFTEGVPGYQQAILGTDILVSSSDLSRSLIYTLGCHSGLNVPDTNTTGSIDFNSSVIA